MGIFDGDAGGFARETVVSIDSGLPEDLTPLSLAVLGQLLALENAALGVKLQCFGPIRFEHHLT